METVADVLEHCKFLVSKGRGAEPGKLFMPKVEAQRRRVNKEHHKRVVFVTDPITYSQWHEQRDRWIELCHGNPTLAYPLMCRVLATVSDEAIKNLCDEGLIDSEQPSLGDA
jgi:hypothetical protein